MSDRLIWIWLSLACGAGSRAYNRLFASFNTLREIYEAPVERFLEIAGIDEKTASALADKDMTRAQNILSLCIKRGWGILTYGDKRYPKRLRTLTDPPVVLYYKGRLPDFDDGVYVAVVGTRKMTPYGERQAYRLSYALSAGGATVVSGMALGCDAMAANGALDAGAATVAVLGCGIDRYYPPEHKVLAEHIIKNGVILTEYPPGTPPAGANFPVRNRIISGLSQCTLVIEAPRGSGALITARTALLQGRDLFAVPGELGGESSVGTNALIRDGARIVTSACDILSLYEFLYPHAVSVEAAEAAERRINEKAGHESAKLRGVMSRSTQKSSESKRENSNENTWGGQEKHILAKKDAKMKAKSTPVESYDNYADADADSDSSYSFAKAREEVAQQKANMTSKPLSMTELPIDENERAVLAALGSSSLTADELVAKGFTANEVMSALTVLEILGYVTALPGGRFVRTR